MPALDNNGCLCHRKGEEEVHHAGVILPQVQAHDGVESAELEAMIRNESSERDAKTSMERKEALGTREPSSSGNQANRERASFRSQHQRQGAYGNDPEDTQSSKLPAASQATKCKNPQAATKMSIARRRFIFRTARSSAK